MLPTEESGVKGEVKGQQRHQRNNTQENLSLVELDVARLAATSPCLTPPPPICPPLCPCSPCPGTISTIRCSAAQNWILQVSMACSPTSRTLCPNLRVSGRFEMDWWGKHHDYNSSEVFRKVCAQDSHALKITVGFFFLVLHHIFLQDLKQLKNRERIYFKLWLLLPGHQRWFCLRS